MNNRSDILVKYDFEYDKILEDGENTKQSCPRVIMFYRNGDVYSGLTDGSAPNIFFPKVSAYEPTTQPKEPDRPTEETRHLVREVVDLLSKECTHSGKSVKDLSELSPRERESLRHGKAVSVSLNNLLADHGLGYISFANGRSYCGGFAHGKFSGYGILKTPGFLDSPAVHKEGTWLNGIFFRGLSQ